MRNKLLLSLILFALFQQCTCKRSSTVKKVVKIATKLADTFLGFSETIQVIDDLISAVTSDTRVKLTTDIEKGSLEKVTEKWESRWAKIDKKIDKLEGQYNDVCIDANKYFNKLRELEANTVDTNQRRMMKEKTDSKEIEFDNAKANASAQVQRMKQMGQMGSDFHNMLLQDVMLTQIDYRIAELNKIEAAARDICDRLQQFAATGSAIVK